MRVVIDPPRWWRWSGLRWLARLVRLSRRWEARGRDAFDLRRDLRRLSDEQHFVVTFDRDHAWTFTWCDDDVHIVEVES